MKYFVLKMILKQKNENNVTLIYKKRHFILSYMQMSTLLSRPLT